MNHYQKLRNTGLSLLIIPLLMPLFPHSVTQIIDSSFPEWEYEIIDRSAKECKVTAYFGSDSDVIIPEYFGEYRVVEIGDNVFYNYNKKEVLTVRIPQAVRKIGEKPYDATYTYSLLPETLTTLTDDARVKIAHYLPSHIQSLGNNSVSNESGSPLVLPASAIDLALPTEEAPGRLFCQRETHLVVDQGNPLYYSSNGALCRKEDSALVYAPDDANYQISDVKTILPYALYDSHIESLTSAVPLESIQKDAFYASNISSFDFSSGLKEIQSGAFDNIWSENPTIILSNDIETIASGAFPLYTPVNIEFEGNAFFSFENGVLISKKDGSVLYCDKSIEGEVVLPDYVTSIEECAFWGCKNLTGITFPQSLTKIGDGAFFGCDGLTHITLPENVTSVEEKAFGHCLNLTDVILENPDTKVSDTAFIYCNSINYNN